MSEELRQGQEEVVLGDLGDGTVLAEALEEGVDVEPEKGHGEGGEEEEDDGLEVGLGEDGPAAGPEGLATDRVHAGAEALHDGEAGDVGEAGGQGAAGQLRFVHVAEEEHGDYGLGEVEESC